METKQNKFGKWYDAYLGDYIPQYAFFSIITCFAYNCIVYWTTQSINAGRQLFDFTTDFDRSVPFRTEWIAVYVTSFIFWGVGYIVISKFNTKEFWFRFVTADLISRTVCGVLFLLIPTTNVRPEIVGTGIFDWMTSVIYASDRPLDLFPSIHCLISLMCYLGVRKNRDVPKWYRCFALIFAILIFISTQFTKQHYFVDVIGGVIIALFCFRISQKVSWYIHVQNAFYRFNQWVFGERTVEDKQESCT